MDIVDSKYIGLISSRLQKFKRVKADLYNFRCPICGDSQKHKNKARGYIYPLKADMNFKCHNCGASTTFNNFLKTIDSTLHKQYVMEKFKERNVGRGSIIPEPKFNFKKPVFRSKLNLPKASEVPIATKYLEKRKINPNLFYFTNEFQKWTNTHKQTFNNINKDESRVIIPLHDTEKNLIGFQGRSLGPNSVKYITVMLSEDAPKIYGLDKIDETKPIFITEGPFDSTFVENSVAMCGSDLDVRTFGWSNYIWVYDNEPRNREIVERISKTINRGDKIVIFPKHIKEKDLNDMTLAGHNVQSIVELNTYQGLEATLKFTQWKKV